MGLQDRRGGWGPSFASNLTLSFRVLIRPYWPGQVYSLIKDTQIDLDYKNQNVRGRQALKKGQSLIFMYCSQHFCTILRNLVYCFCDMEFGVCASWRSLVTNIKLDIDSLHFGKKVRCYLDDMVTLSNRWYQGRPCRPLPFPPDRAHTGTPHHQSWGNIWHRGGRGWRVRASLVRIAIFLAIHIFPQLTMSLLSRGRVTNN